MCTDSKSSLPENKSFYTTEWMCSWKIYCLFSWHRVNSQMRLLNWNTHFLTCWEGTFEPNLSSSRGWICSRLFNICKSQTKSFELLRHSVGKAACNSILEATAYNQLGFLLGKVPGVCYYSSSLFIYLFIGTKNLKSGNIQFSFS